jgi:hypothetical protein
MANLKSFLFSSRLRFVLITGLFWSAPLAVFFLFNMYNSGQLTFEGAMFTVVICSAAGAAWSLAMWFTVVIPLLRKYPVERSGGRRS